MKKKAADCLRSLYGWGILLCLSLGGLTVLGYLSAVVIGGETAAIICTFLYKKLFKWLFYASDIFVLMGLASMYLSDESAMTLKTKDQNE